MHHAVFINRLMPPFFSGAAKNDLITAHYVARTGWRVTILTNRGCALPERFATPNLDLLGICTPRFGRISRLLAALQLAAFVVRHQDTIHIARVRGFAVEYGLMFALLRRLAPSVRRVIHPACHGIDDIRTIRAQPLGLIASREYLRADAVFVMNDVFLPSLQDFSYPRSRIFRVVNPVDPAYFSSNLSANLPEPARSLRTSSDFVVTTVGAISKRKRQLFLARSLAQLLTQLPSDVRVDLWCIGPTAGDFQRQGHTFAAAEAANIEKQLRLIEDSVSRLRICLFGEVPFTGPLLSASDVYLHAAIREGEANAINEAMALGVPVILPNEPVYAQRITRAQQLAFSTADELIDACRRLLLDASLRKTLGQMARDYVFAHRSPEVTAQIYAAALDRVLSAQ